MPEITKVELRCSHKALKFNYVTNKDIDSDKKSLAVAGRRYRAYISDHQSLTLERS